MSSKTVELECVAASGIFKIGGYGRLDFTNGRARVKAEDIPKLEASLDGRGKKLWGRQFGLVGTFTNPGRNLAPEVVRDDNGPRTPAANPASQQQPAAKGADFTEFENDNEDLILKAQELAEREEAEAQARLAAQQAGQAPPSTPPAAPKKGKGGRGKAKTKASPAA